MKARLPVDWRLLPVQVGVLATFALIPLWKRMPYAPTTYDPLYAFGFLLAIPMGITIAAWLLSGLPGLRDLLRDPLRRVWALALVALAVWMHLSVSWSFIAEVRDLPNVAQSAANRFTLIVAWVLAAACAGPPPRAVIAVLVFGGVWNSAIAILQVANQASIGLGFFGEFNLDATMRSVSVLQSGDLRWLRPYGLLPHPNPLGGLLAVSLLSSALWVVARDKRLRLLGITATAIILWGLLLTFSRAAWLGFAGGAFVLLPLLLRGPLRISIPRRSFAIALTVMVATGALFAVNYRDLIVARTGTTAEGVEIRSVVDRVIFQDFALRATVESPQNTLRGIGAGNFPWRASYYIAETDYDLRGDNVHQVYLSALVETGLVGLTLLTVALVAGIEASLRRIRETRAAPYAAGLLAGVMALALVGLFDHYPWSLLQFQALWWGLLAVGGKRGYAGEGSPQKRPSPEF